MIDSKKMWQQLSPIAKKHFDAETLETRNSDSHDFYEVAVWGIRDALIAAYMVGHQQGRIDSVNSRYGINNATVCDACDHIFAPYPRNETDRGDFCDNCLENPYE